MLDIVLWSILAIWVGLAVLLLIAVVSLIGGSTIHMLLDRRAVKGTVWCPALHRTMHVIGWPASFGRTAFDDLSRCEAFNDAPIRCRKDCVRGEEPAAAAKAS